MPLDGEFSPELSQWFARANPLVEMDRQIVRDHGLAAFMNLAWPTVESEGSFSNNWHIDAIAEHLEAVSKGDIRRLVIMIPPRSMKSLSSSVFWPAWDWIANPQRRFLFASYAQSLSFRDSIGTRNVIQSPWYQQRWGDRFKLRSDSNQVEKFTNDRNGYRQSTSVGAKATGLGGDICLVDDPHNVSEAEGPIREKTLRWWDETMSSRLNDPKTGAFVIVQQRVHHQDLAGHVMARRSSMPYTVLCYDNDMEILTEYGWVRFVDLKRGVRVMGVDPATLKGTWQEPTNYLTKHYAGPMVHYKSATCDLLVTPEHRMVFKDFNDWKDPGNRRLNWRVKPAAECPSHLVLPQAIDWDVPSKVVQFGGRNWHPDLLAEFMGWYLSEGSASSKGYPYAVTLTQNDGPLADELDACLRLVPFNHCHYFSKTRLPKRIWAFNRKALWNELAPLGKSINRHIPDVIKSLPAVSLGKLLMAYAKGDGHFARRNVKKITISSVSKRMIDDLQECAVKAGWASSMGYRYDDTGGNFPGGEPRKPVHVWKLYLRTPRAEVGEDRKWYARLQAHNITRPQYDGLVHCVSVPTGALVVRRNGRVTVCGNCLPAEYESDHPQRWFRDPRKEEGELLWPSRMPRAELEELKANLGEYSASGQLQQRPVPREGGMFKRSWFPLVASIAPDTELWSRAWDLAGTVAKQTKSDPDWTATVRLGYSPSRNKYIIVHVDRWRMGPGAVRAKILETAQADGFHVKQTVPKDPGQAGVDQAQQLVAMLSAWETIAEPPSGDKATRAGGLAGQAEVGNVEMLANDDWNEMFLTELSSFPLGGHDDMLDAAASAYNRIRSTTTGIIDYYAQLQKGFQVARDQEAERERRILSGEQFDPGFAVTETKIEDDMGAAIATLTGRRP